MASTTIGSVYARLSQTLDSYIVSIACIAALAYYLYRSAAKIPHDAKRADPGHQFFLGSLKAVTSNIHRLWDRNYDVHQLHDEQSWFQAMPSFVSPSFVFLTLGSDPALTEYVLKTNFANYVKGPVFNHRNHIFLGDGIFAVDGKDWQLQRKIASHVFTSRNIKEDMTQVFNSNANVVERLLDQYAADGRSFDVQDLYFRYTMQSFSEIAFGERPDLLTDTSVKSPASEAARHYDTLQAHIAIRIRNPIWQLTSKLKLGYEKELKDSAAVVDSYAYSVIGRRKEAGWKQLSDKPDLLSRFVAYSREQNEELSNQDLRDIVINFIVAGRDTTACLLTWSTYQLCKYPQLEQQLFEAVQQEITSESSTYEEVAYLPAIQSFLLETLRIYPSVPMDARTARNEDVLPDGTRVPKGCVVRYSPYLFGRSKKLWGEDALEFKPSRWLSSTSRTGIREESQYKYIQFNAGPRLCLGKSVALHEAGLLLARLVHKYQFKLTKPDEVPEPLLSLTMPIKGGLAATVTQRS